MEEELKQFDDILSGWIPVEKVTTHKFEFYRKAKSIFSSLGVLKFLTEDENLPRDIIRGDILKDIVNAKVPARYLLETDDVHQACKIAGSLGMDVVIIGSLTSGTDNFGKPGAVYDEDKILAIKPMSQNIEIVVNGIPKERTIIHYLKSSQIRINKDAQGRPVTITAGPGLVPDDINNVLPRGYWVPLDLTTKNQAQLGAIYATGGMGPSRIRPHETIKRVVVSDGETLRELTGDEIEKHEGLLGLTGAVVEIEYQVLKVPDERFGLLVPLKIDEEDKNEKSTWVEKLKTLLAALHPALNLKLDNGKITSQWEDGMIDGVEVITKQELRLVEKSSASPESRMLARQMIAEMKKNGSTFMVLITGRSKRNIFEIENTKNNPIETLLRLMDENIIGETTEIRDLNKMATLREDIPDRAKIEGKTPTIPGQVVTSVTTDINTALSDQFLEYIESLNPEERIAILQDIFGKMLKPYLDYEKELNEIEEVMDSVKVVVRRYGHAHTRDIDLHTRATVMGEKTQMEGFKDAITLVKNAKKRLQERLIALRQDDRISVSHGEKGKPPTISQMQDSKKEEVLNLINSAPGMFKWRNSPLTSPLNGDLCPFWGTDHGGQGGI